VFGANDRRTAAAFLPGFWHVPSLQYTATTNIYTVHISATVPTISYRLTPQSLSVGYAIPTRFPLLSLKILAYQVFWLQLK